MVRKEVMPHNDRKGRQTEYRRGAETTAGPKETRQTTSVCEMRKESPPLRVPSIGKTSPLHDRVAGEKENPNGVAKRGINGQDLQESIPATDRAEAAGLRSVINCLIADNRARVRFGDRVL